LCVFLPGAEWLQLLRRGPRKLRGGVPGAAGIVAGHLLRRRFLRDRDLPRKAVETKVARGAAIDEKINGLALLHRDAADARVGLLVVQHPAREDTFARADQPAA